MAYETGTYSSTSDLLQKLAAFCEANGWTRDRNAAMGTGWAWVGHRGGDYVSIRASNNETATANGGFARSWTASIAGYALCVTMGTSYNAGASAWKWLIDAGAPFYADDTAGVSYGAIGCAMTALGSGAGLSYDFFSYDNGDHIFAVVERSAGLFSFIGWGRTVVKYGAWTGGRYLIGSRGPYYWNGGVSHFPSSAGFGLTSPPPAASFNSEPTAYFTCDADGSERWFTVCGYSINGPASTPHGATGNVGGSDCYDADYNESGLSAYIPTTKWTYMASGPSGFGLQLLLPIMLYVKRGATTTMSPVGELPYQFLTRRNNVANRGTITYGGSTYMFFPKLAVKKEV